MAYYIMFLWIPGRDGTRIEETGNILVNALHDFHRFNRRYHVNKYLEVGLAIVEVDLYNQAPDFYDLKIFLK